MLALREPVNKMAMAMAGVWSRRAGSWLARKEEGSGAAPAAATAAVADEIRRITLATEPQFVALATQLQGIYTSAIAFARDADEQVHSLRELLQAGDWSGDAGIASRATRELDASLDETEAMQDELVRIGKALVLLQTKGSQLRRLGTRLDVCRTAFAVDCGRNAEYKIAFSGFLDELGHLSGEIARFGESIQDQSQAVRQRLQRHGAQTRLSLQRLHQLARLSQAAAFQSSQETEALLTQSHGALTGIERAAANLRTHAQEAGYFMQFGDIVRQKLEHVTAALDTLCAPSPPPRAPWVLAVQAAQLESVADEIAGAVARLHHAFSSMIKEAEELSGALRARRPDPATGDSGLRRFADAVCTLTGLQAQGRELHQRVQSMNRDAGRNAAELSDQLEVVQALNHRMHLLALNAIIKSEGLGEQSATLGVLSTHIHELFIDSSGLVEETICVLREVSPQLTEDNSALARGIPDVDAALAQLEEMEAGMELAVARSADRHAAHRALLDTAREHLGFLEQLAASMQQHRAQLESMRAHLPSVQRPGAGEMEDLFRLYTMESERTTHRMVLGLPQPDLHAEGRENPSIAVSPSADIPSSGDDTNIEFF